MQKPKTNEVADAAKLAGPRGRFVGLVSTAKERYQVVLIETAGDVVTKREIISSGKVDNVDGKLVEGMSLSVAWYDFQMAGSKLLKDKASDLWQRFVK